MVISNKWIESKCRDKECEFVKADLKSLYKLSFNMLFKTAQK